MNTSKSYIADAIAGGKAAYGEQRFIDALVIFQSLLDADEYNGWIHFHVGQCLNRIGNPSAALIHLSIARSHICDYKIDAEFCQALYSLGRPEQLLEVVNTWVDDGRFWNLAADLFFSANNLYAVADMWHAKQNNIIAAYGHQNYWVQFFLRSADTIVETCKTLGITHLPLTFSKKYPNFLEIMTNEDLRRLIICSLDAHTHVMFASWDLRSRLRNPEHLESIYNSLPLWLREKCLSESLRLIFDASEEAPIIQPGDIERCMLNYLSPLAQGRSQKLKFCALTANSMYNTGTTDSTSTKILEYNIYPILVAQGYDVVRAAQSCSETATAAYHFTLLTGMPRSHRIALIILLQRHKLLQHVNYSWWGNSNNKNQRGIHFYLDQANELLSDLHLTQSELLWIKELPERIIPGPPQAWSSQNTHFMCDSVNVEFMQSGRFHIVCETEFTQKYVLRLTEKSIKPLITGVPFIIVGVSGIVDHIRNFGFDLLDDFIDHSYDLEHNPSQRLNKIVDELIRLTEVVIPPDRLEHYQRANTERLKHWVEQRRSEHVTQLFSWLADNKPQ